MFEFITTLCLCFVCVVIVLTNAQSLQMTPNQKIEQHFYEKCFYKTHDLLPFQLLYNDTTEFMTRMDSAAQLLPDQKRTFCEVERKQLVTKAEKVSKDLMNCLVPQEQYLSEFVASFVKESLHFLCHNHGENIDDLFSPRGKRCTETIEKSQTSELEDCFRKIFPPLSDKYVTKKELCDNMGIAKKCFNIMLDRHCPSTKSMHELNEKYFKYIGKTCSGCINYLSTSLLIMSIILPFTFRH